MPRSNRPRSSRARRRPGRRQQEDEPLDLETLRAGWRRVETRRGVAWNVQPVPAPRAVKTYVCPGCGGEVVPGTAHLVVWRADGVLGDAADLSARRHWHEHCWRIA